MGLCISCRRDKQQSLQNEKVERNIISSVTTLAPLQIYIEECPQFTTDTIVYKEPLTSEDSSNKKLAASIGYDEWLVRPGHSDSLCCNCHEGSAVNVTLSSFISEIGNSASNSRMANTISNMKMTNPIKGLVSKRRKRYTQDGFNLDLTYIQDNLIAMGFPAERLEGVYRNHIDDVVKFLESKHKGHYKIYNLCSEKSYDCSKFQKRVADYPFADHNPPKMELIQPFCADVHEWLSKDVKNVAAVHCKAGKGRTGTMVCCYMLHSRKFETADEVLDFYGQARTHDRKGVTIPSQRRYVNYYSMLVRENLSYTPVALQITEIILDPLPLLSSTQGHLHFSISESQRDKPYKCIKRYRSIGNDPKKGVGVMKGGALHINLDLCIPLSGDIKLEFFTKSKMMRREKLFHFWFNTFFVRESTLESNSDTNATLQPHNNTNNSCEFDSSNSMSLIFNKCELDDAHKDKTNKLYSADFKVTLMLQKVPSSGYLATRGPTSRATHQETPSESSEASSSEESNEEEEGWDSGECTDKPLMGPTRASHAHHNKTGHSFVVTQDILKTNSSLLSPKRSQTRNNDSSECNDYDNSDYDGSVQSDKQLRLQPSQPHPYTNPRMSLGHLENRKMSLEPRALNLLDVKTYLSGKPRPRREST